LFPRQPRHKVAKISSRFRGGGGAPYVDYVYRRANKRGGARMSEHLGRIAAVARKAWVWWALAGLSSAALVVHGGLYYPRLPDLVPTHFGLDGHVTETGSKDTLFAIYLTTGLATALLLAVVSAGVPLCDPGVPNRSYWVGTQARRLETHKQLSSLMLQCLCLTNLLLMWMFDEVFRFGIACAEPRDLTNPLCHDEQQRQMWWPWVGMGLYIVMCLWLPARLMQRFYHPPPRRRGRRRSSSPRQTRTGVGRTPTTGSAGCSTSAPRTPESWYPSASASGGPSTWGWWGGRPPAESSQSPSSCLSWLRSCALRGTAWRRSDAKCGGNQ